MRRGTGQAKALPVKICRSFKRFLGEYMKLSRQLGVLAALTVTFTSSLGAIAQVTEASSAASATSASESLSTATTTKIANKTPRIGLGSRWWVAPVVLLTWA
jgi:hypothetical protein